MKWYLPPVVILLLITSCKNDSNKAFQESKENRFEKEIEQPLNFLTVAHSDKRNVIGQTVIRAQITNNASICSYTNVRVKMLYYKDGKLVTNHEEVVADVISPKEQIKFKAKYFTPKGTDSVALSIMKAEVVGDKHLAVDK